MTVERLVRRTVHVAPIEQHYADIGVSEGRCDMHGVFHIARASLAMGVPMECPWCRLDRGRVAA